jgi:hypothetical protein
VGIQAKGSLAHRTRTSREVDRFVSYLFTACIGRLDVLVRTIRHALDLAHFYQRAALQRTSQRQGLLCKSRSSHTLFAGSWHAVRYYEWEPPNIHQRLRLQESDDRPGGTHAAAHCRGSYWSSAGGFSWGG